MSFCRARFQCLERFVDGGCGGAGSVATIAVLRRSARAPDTPKSNP